MPSLICSEFPANSKIFLRNYNGPVYSYGRRSSALQVRAAARLAAGMTPSLNVRTLAKRHPLYLSFRFEQGAMFLLNSCLRSLAASRLRGKVLLLTYDRFFA